MYVPLSVLIVSGMIWTPYDLLKKFYSFYAAVVDIVDRHGLTIETYCRNQPNKIYKPMLSLLRVI